MWDCRVVSGFALRFAGSVHTPTRSCRYLPHLNGCDRCRKWTRIASALAGNPRRRSLERDCSSDGSLLGRGLWGIELAVQAETVTPHGPSQPKRNLVALADVLGYIAEIANVQASKRGIMIAVEGEDGLQANIDHEQLQRGLLNLLLNAIDATPVGGQVAIRSSRPSAQSVELQVENSGAPIPQEVLSKLFEPFYTTKPHGTGLGLAISRNIARVQGGDLIVARNEPGHVCFTMTVSDEASADSGAISHG